MTFSSKRENNLSHLAIIMDGNGRWSEYRGLPRQNGHKEGVKSLRNLLTYIEDFQIPYLTVFSFSTDNWKRPKSETSNLMNLLRKFLNIQDMMLADLLFQKKLKNQYISLIMVKSQREFG